MAFQWERERERKRVFNYSNCIRLGAQTLAKMGWSPGLVVMGGNSCSESHGFKSQHHILDGHFSHIFVVKNVMFVWKDEKEAGDGPFRKHWQRWVWHSWQSSCFPHKRTRVRINQQQFLKDHLLTLYCKYRKDENKRKGVREWGPNKKHWLRRLWLLLSR